MRPVNETVRVRHDRVTRFWLTFFRVSKWLREVRGRSWRRRVGLSTYADALNELKRR